MEKREIRIGLLGFGAMGKTHAYSVAALPFFISELPFIPKIAGVFTRSAEKSAAIAKTYGFSVATDNEDDLIFSDSIDVIDICTPNACHFETAKKALAAGKHIYCEKPLTHDGESSAALASLAQESHLVCGVVFNNRFLPAIVRAKQLLEEGRLGRIFHFDFSYLHNSATNPEKAAGWKQDAAVCGKGGVLFDLGSHILDLAVYLLGPFATIMGKSQIAFPSRRGMDGARWQTNASEAFYMMATTKSGAYGMLTAGKLATGTADDLSFAVYGEKGALRFSLMNPNFLSFYDATAAPAGEPNGFTALACGGNLPFPAGLFPSPKAPVGWLRGHVMSMFHFFTAVYEGKPHHPDFSDAAYIGKLMDAALLSDATGTEVKVTP